MRCLWCRKISKDLANTYAKLEKLTMCGYTNTSVLLYNGVPRIVAVWCTVSCKSGASFISIRLCSHFGICSVFSS